MLRHLGPLVVGVALVVGCGERPAQDTARTPISVSMVSTIPLPPTSRADLPSTTVVVPTTTGNLVKPAITAKEPPTTFALDGFVFSYPASLKLSPMPNRRFVIDDPKFPSVSQDFGDENGRLVTMTIAVGGQQLIDSNADAGAPLDTVQIGTRVFYTPKHTDDPNSYTLMTVIGDNVAAFGFSLFTPDEALALVKNIDVAPEGK